VDADRADAREAARRGVVVARAALANRTPSDATSDSSSIDISPALRPSSASRFATP